MTTRRRRRRGGQASSTRFKVAVALLIALTSLVGALSAWRAEAASMKGEQAERKGFADRIVDEQAKTTIRQDLQGVVLDYERAQSFLRLGATLQARADQSAPADRARLLTQARAQLRAGKAVLDGISRDALRPDGTLDLANFYAVNYSQVRQTQDVDPEPELARSDAQATKSERLVGLTALLVAAALFFTAAQVSRRLGPRRLYVGGGALVLGTSVVLLALVELAT
jgi:hypothetical protein